MEASNGPKCRIPYVFREAVPAYFHALADRDLVWLCVDDIAKNPDPFVQFDRCDG
jgi:hypothetical protein